MRRSSLMSTLPADQPSAVPPSLYALESEVMEEVWRRGGELSVREVLQGLNDRGPSERAYTTVMTVMRRLDDKGLLERRRQGQADVYRPRLSREEYLKARAQAEVDALVEQFGDEALVHFARRMNKLDPARRERLRRISRRD